MLGNLEVTLPEATFDPRDRHAAQMRGHPQYATVLREAGFHVLNLANNHADQHGIEAFESTVQVLREVGISPCGIRGPDGDWSSLPVVTEIGDVRVGILGYSLRPPQYGLDDPPYAQGPVPPLLRDIERLKRDVDHVLVSVHWGEEFVQTPSVREMETGRSLIDAGATAVFGHHPHVLRPIDYGKDALIAYSHGNLVSDMTWQPQLRRGQILALELDSNRLVRAKTLETLINKDYSVNVEGRWCDVMACTVEGMGDGEYRRAVKRSLNRYRVAAYAHAIRNLRSTPPAVFSQLLKDTLRNKFVGLIRSAEHG